MIVPMHSASAAGFFSQSEVGQFYTYQNTCSVPPTNFREVICIFVGILRQIVPLLAAAALLVFFWGLARFVYSASGDGGSHEAARNIMFWGIIGLFVMVSIWGIVNFLASDLVGTSSVSVPRLPTF